MELGLFIFLSILGALGYWKNNNLYILGMSIVAFFILAVMLASSTEDVRYTTSSSSSAEIRDDVGLLMQTGNGTKTEHTTVVDSNNLIMVAYIFYGFATFTSLIFLYRTIQLGQQGRY